MAVDSDGMDSSEMVSIDIDSSGSSSALESGKKRIIMTTQQQQQPHEVVFRTPTSLTVLSWVNLIFGLIVLPLVMIPVLLDKNDGLTRPERQMGLVLLLAVMGLVMLFFGLGLPVALELRSDASIDLVFCMGRWNCPDHVQQYRKSAWAKWLGWHQRPVYYNSLRSNNNNNNNNAGLRLRPHGWEAFILPTDAEGYNRSVEQVVQRVDELYEKNQETNHDDEQEAEEDRFV